MNTPTVVEVKVRLPRDLVARLKFFSIRHSVSMSDLVEDLVATRANDKTFMETWRRRPGAPDLTQHNQLRKRRAATGTIHATRAKEVVL